MNAVVQWTNTDRTERLIHIHGTRDEVFPLRYWRPDYILKGGHSLVFNQHVALNDLLTDIFPSSQHHKPV